MSEALYSAENGVGRILLNRPERFNAFTASLHQSLRDALDHAEADDTLRCLLLSGVGKAFCAGQDLKERYRGPGEEPTDLGMTLDRDVNPLISRLRALPYPVVALVNGAAAGAGASLALAADIVIGARSAKFSFGFCKIGLIPDGGATWTVPRLVGGALAAGLLLTGEAIGADQAAQWGLIWKCVEDADLEASGESLAAYFASQPAEALAQTKLALQKSPHMSFAAQLEHERDVQQKRGFSADYAEGVAAFIERRTPQFRNR